MLTAIALTVVSIHLASLLALFIFVELERKEPQVTIQEERRIHLEAAALLDAAVGVCRKGLGEASSDVRLSVVHLTDGRWRLVADFDSAWAPWSAEHRDRDELLEIWADDGCGWIGNCLRAGKGAKS